jgi:succinate dehydrogenase / fumarate reductase cytochrome b subunit
MAINQRPLSPHIQIYKPQLTSVLSILHRITGVALAAGAVFLTWWLFAALSGEIAFACLQKLRHSFIGQLALFGWTFSFVYHLLNGVRHLKWDAGYGLGMKSVYISGYIVAIGSAIITVMIWIVAGAR